MTSVSAWISEHAEKSNLAVNTPAVTKDAVYVAFGNADIARYSHDGKLIWVNRYHGPIWRPQDGLGLWRESPGSG